MAAPSPDVSNVCGREVGRLKMSAVTCIAASDCEPPPETRGARHRNAGPGLNVLRAFSKRIREPLENGAKQMGARVHVGEADHRAARLRARRPDTRGPVGLQHQAVAAGRSLLHEPIEKRFGRHAFAERGRDFGWPNCCLNQLTIQKPRKIWTSAMNFPGSAAG